MTFFAVNAFLGERPALSARLLEPRMAQVARMARLMSGDLEAWRDLAEVAGLEAAVNTIYAMDIGSGVPKWLYFTDAQLGAGAVEVDVARGPIQGDASERTYLTGLDAPRWTNLAAATTPALPATHAPFTTYLLGVPAPTVAPTLEIQAGSGGTEIPIENPGAENGDTSGWSVDEGDFDVHVAGEVPGLDPHSGDYFFRFGNVATAKVSQDFILSTFGLTADSNFELSWFQAGGASGSTASMKLIFLDLSAAVVGEVDSDALAIAAADGWVQRKITAQAPADTYSVKIEIDATRVGIGECDAYIDDVAIKTVDVSASYDGTSLADWTISSNIDIHSDHGRPPPAFHFFRKEGKLCWMYRNMRVENSSVYRLSFDWYTNNSDDIQLSIILSANKDGVGSGLRFAGNVLHLINSTAWASNSVTTDTIASVDLNGYMIHAELAVEKTSANQANLTWNLTDANSNAPISTGTRQIAISGGYIGFRGQGSGGNTDNGWLDNVAFQITSPPPDNTAARDLLTNYLYTFVNGGGEESAPSPVSRSVQRSDDIDIAVTTPVVAPADYGIVSKNLYRAKSDGSGTSYFLVSTRPLAEATFVDTIDDSALGDLLESENYDLPPADLRGLIALPNGVMAGFRQDKNEICLSVQNRPHAWPVGWRLATDYPVVSISAMDTDIIVATQANPYLVYCSDPSAAQMAKLEKPQGCVSKRSMVTMDGVGVLYASPDGLTAVSRGSVEVVTKQIFTREQWQALAPESIRAAAHNGMYWFFFDTGATQAGYIYEPRSGSLVPLDFFAEAAYANPLTDRLYFVIDDNLVEWNAADTYRTYVWLSKLFQLQSPTSFEFGIVRTQGTGDLTMRLYADGADVPFFEGAVTGNREFLLPAVTCEDTVEIELEGFRIVRGVAIAETIEELP